MEIYTKENFLKIKKMGKGYLHIIIAKNMKVNINMVLEKEKVHIIIWMVANMKV